MPTNVNLDAMIWREDFESKEGVAQSSRLGKEIKINDLLRKGVGIVHNLRKPDFQRETSGWEPEKIVAFVKSFLDGDLIPAIIMWNSDRTGKSFVIDGAHRLSALIGWLHDDYGDASISRPFFNHQFQPGQLKAAKKTKELIEKHIGTYDQLTAYAVNPGAAPSELALRRARNMGTFNIDLQWVTGDARKAEKAFYKINQSATEIDPTELDLIMSRKKPNAVSTRALIRAGTGHKYWSAFTEPTQKEIEKLAEEIYEGLFKPVLDYPIKTSSLPAAGGSYSADSVKMTFDLVNYLNNVPERPSKKKTKDSALNFDADVPENEEGNDTDGADTIKYLKTVKATTSRVFGPHASSLGLHPGIYCYGATGKFQPTSFLATIAFVRDLIERNQFYKFTVIRSKFEEYLLRKKHFMNQVARAYGGGTRSTKPIVALFQDVMVALSSDKSDEDIFIILKKNTLLSAIEEFSEDDIKHGRNFSRATKNLVALKNLLEAEVRCGICNARLPSKAISFDHVKRKQDGGDGNPSNAQMTHPYCNTGYKELQKSKQKGQS